MIKVIEAIVILTLLLFSFFLGVKYSENVKGFASWMFEVKEQEIEVPANIKSEASIDNPVIEGNPAPSTEDQEVLLDKNGELIIDNLDFDLDLGLDFEESEEIDGEDDEPLVQIEENIVPTQDPEDVTIIPDPAIAQ